MNEQTMKKTPSKSHGSRVADMDEILPEYDFKRGSRNKYASRYGAGSVVVVLEPDVAAEFPASSKANQALRALARIKRKNRR